MLSTIYYGWWVVLPCFIINLYVGSMIFFSFTAFFEPIQQEFGWSYIQISLAASLRGLEMGIFAPIVGFLVDRFGSRKLLLGGTIVIGIGLVVLSFTQSLLMFYLCFLFIALGTGGCTSVVTMTAVAIWFRKNVGLALGIMASGFGAGGLIIPLIVFLIDASGWRLTLVILPASLWRGWRGWEQGDRHASLLAECAPSEGPHSMRAGEACLSPCSEGMGERYRNWCDSIHCRYVYCRSTTD